MTMPNLPRPSAPVRTCPPVSIDKRRGEENNPPVAPPPQAVGLQLDPIPLEVRRLRVEAGSRRKRDLAAIAWAAELEALEERQRAEAEIKRCASPLERRDLRAFIQARRRLRRALAPSTYRLWIKPLRPTGHLDDTLLIFAPDEIRAWTERRYSALIVEALEGTGFSSVSFAGETR